MFNNLQIDSQGNFTKIIAPEDVQDRINFLTNDTINHQKMITQNNTELTYLTGQQTQATSIKSHIV